MKLDDTTKAIPLSYAKTNYKTTIKRLRNCYMCKYRFEDNVESHCKHCPPLQLMKELNFIIDFYFSSLKEQKGNEKK